MTREDYIKVRNCHNLVEELIKSGKVRPLKEGETIDISSVKVERIITGITLTDFGDYLLTQKGRADMYLKSTSLWQIQRVVDFFNEEK